MENDNLHNFNNSDSLGNTTTKKKTAKRKNTKKTTTKTSTSKQDQAKGISKNVLTTGSISAKTNTKRVTDSSDNNEKIASAIFYLGLGIIGGIVILGAKKLIDKITE